jgi:hypothetical protein
VHRSESQVDLLGQPTLVRDLDDQRQSECARHLAGGHRSAACSYSEPDPVVELGQHGGHLAGRTHAGHRRVGHDEHLVASGDDLGRGVVDGAGEVEHDDVVAALGGRQHLAHRRRIDVDRPALIS